MTDRAEPSPPGRYRVVLQKEQLVFSAGHFITFAGDICERLHGHNYGVKAEVCGPLDQNRYVIDFIAFRDALMEIVQRLDHHMLLPTRHSLIQVEQRPGNDEGDAPIDEVWVRFGPKRWVFPAEDCCLLPVVNTTAEELASWIAGQLRAALKPTVGEGIESLEVAVDENHGQWGICQIDW